MNEYKKINVLRGRKISLENAKLTGTGATCNVYTLPDDSIVKVLNSQDNREAEREIQLSKWAFLKGIPTAISYDVVDVDGHPGLVYESLGRGNIRNELRDKPDEFDSIMERYVDFLKNINAISDDDGMLVSAKEVFIENLLTVQKHVTPTEYYRILQLVDTIPESNHIVHGDCHMKNVKILNDKFYLIDLDTLATGDPIFELMGISCCYNAYNDGAPYNSFFDIDNEIVENAYDYILDQYFDGISNKDKIENIRKIELLTHIFMLYCLDPNNPDESDLFKKMYNKVKENLFEIDNLVLKH